MGTTPAGRGGANAEPGPERGEVGPGRSRRRWSGRAGWSPGRRRRAGPAPPPPELRGAIGERVQVSARGDRRAGRRGRAGAGVPAQPGGWRGAVARRAVGAAPPIPHPASEAPGFPSHRAAALPAAPRTRRPGPCAPRSLPFATRPRGDRGLAGSGLVPPCHAWNRGTETCFFKNPLQTCMSLLSS